MYATRESSRILPARTSAITQEEITYKNRVYFQCSDTVVVFSERIEPTMENDIKSESFA
jgi:hypothetical protein